MERVVESDGFKWIVHPNSDDHLALGGHETALGPIMQSMCNPSRTFVNVGAHVGTWAIRMSPFVSQVHAFEANPRTANWLQDNIDINELHDKIIVHRAAAWDKTGETLQLIDVNGIDTGGSTRVAEQTDTGKGTYTGFAAKTVRLDNCPLGVPGLIVMDVEGAEARVLRGAVSVLKTFRPNLIIELHEGHPGTDPDLRKQVYDVLDYCDYDYHSVEITGERLLCRPAEEELDEVLSA